MLTLSQTIKKIDSYARQLQLETMQEYLQKSKDGTNAKMGSAEPVVVHGRLTPEGIRLLAFLRLTHCSRDAWDRAGYGTTIQTKRK